MEKIKNRLRRLKASNTIIKFFKSSSNGSGKHFSASSDEILNIRHTKDTQTFRKPSLTSDNETRFSSTLKDRLPTKPTSHEPTPAPGNQTIIEGKYFFTNWCKFKGENTLIISFFIQEKLEYLKRRRILIL